MKKRLVVRLLSALIASMMIVTPVLAAPNIDALENKKSAAEEKNDKLQKELNETISKIDKLENELIQTGEEIEKVNGELIVAEEKEKQQYADMKKRIKYMYEDGDASAIEAMMNAEDFSEFLNKAEYVSTVHDYDREKLEEYVETKEKVSNLKEKLQGDQKKLTSKQTKYEQKQKDLDKMISDNASAIEQLEGMIEDAVAQAAAEEAARQAEEAAKEAAKAAEEQQTKANEKAAEAAADAAEDAQAEAQQTVAKGDSNAAAKIVAMAYSQLGVPYKWGGTTPSGFDCSGLVQYCHRAAGISIARSSGAQGSGGTKVTNPQPGDVVCFSGHVGIYIGGGKMIHAPHTGTVVKIASVSSIGKSHWYRRYW